MSEKLSVVIQAPPHPTNYHARGKFRDLTGLRCEMLTVLCYAGSVGGKGRSRWLCVCDCGNLTIVATKALWHGATKSCGCWKSEIVGRLISNKNRTHAKSNTPMYRVWAAMLSRCRNKNNGSYPAYGGRGIKVCERWHKFENFLVDMGERPEGMTIERKDSNGDYCPENCCWLPRELQPQNTRRNVVLEINGDKKILSEWARVYNRPVSLVAYRIRKGWDPLKALTTLPGPSGRRKIQEGV